jgi:hypothetical protein
VALFLRLFANCESARTAADVAARLGLALSKLAAKEFAPPKPYWKVPGLFEFTYTLSPATESSFEAVLSCTSGGWSQSTSGAERSGVWTRTNDHVLFAPEVAWANVELHETAA